MSLIEKYLEKRNTWQRFLFSSLINEGTSSVTIWSKGELMKVQDLEFFPSLKVEQATATRRFQTTAGGKQFWPT